MVLKKINDVIRKDTKLTEVIVGNRLMYIVETMGVFKIVDPHMTLNLGEAKTKQEAIDSIVEAL